MDHAQRREQARLDKLAAAEVTRLERDAATDRQVKQLNARNELAREAKLDDRKAALEAQQARDAKRAARATALRGWLVAHVVDLLIYPLAVASAVMAVPAMASFGHDTYRSVTGYLLPLLSEFGMWAFAIAVTRSRKADPDKPVGFLQAGIWLSAAAAVALNAVHGLRNENLGAGAVMAIVSVFGVVAHQLLTASPRRTPAERDTARRAREAAGVAKLAEAKVERARRAAVDQAVTEIEPDGTARLVFTPGAYRLTRRGRLAPATVPGLPVTPIDPIGESIAAQAAAFLKSMPDPDSIGPAPSEDTEPDSPDGPGPVATLDPPGDQRKSRPKRPRLTDPVRRSIEDLRVELTALVADSPDAVNVDSAESIRKALRCAPKYARQLREEFSTNQK